MPLPDVPPRSSPVRLCEDRAAAASALPLGLWGFNVTPAPTAPTTSTVAAVAFKAIPAPAVAEPIPAMPAALSAAPGVEAAASRDWISGRGTSIPSPSRRARRAR
jgi:hypothetical protein